MAITRRGGSPPGVYDTASSSGPSSTSRARVCSFLFNKLRRSSAARRALRALAFSRVDTVDVPDFSDNFCAISQPESRFFRLIPPSCIFLHRAASIAAGSQDSFALFPCTDGHDRNIAKTNFSFSFPFRVRYAEIDRQGILFNAHYLTNFDTATAEYVRAVRTLQDGQDSLAGTYFHTVRNLVAYKAQIGFDDQIDVFVHTSRLGRSSVTLVNEIYRKNRNTMLTFGEAI